MKFIIFPFRWSRRGYNNKGETAMKYVIALLVPLGLLLGGCTQATPLTGRSVSISQYFDRCAITGNNALPASELGEEQKLADIIGAAGDFLSPKGGVWSTAETEGGQTATPTTTVTPTITAAYGGGGVDIATAFKSLIKSFTGTDGKVDREGITNALIGLGYDKKAVEDCVNGGCTVGDGGS